MFSHMEFIALYIREYDHIVLVHYRDISDGKEVDFSPISLYLLYHRPNFRYRCMKLLVGFNFSGKTK